MLTSRGDNDRYWLNLVRSDRMARGILSTTEIAGFRAVSCPQNGCYEAEHVGTVG